VGLNSVDPDAAVAWYLAVWPEARATEMDGKPAIAAEMYLVINPVDDPPAGAFDPELGRPAEQSAFWHIGAFVNTTEDRDRMAALGIDHLPLHTGPDGDAVWRSGLTPYAGIVTADDLTDAASADPRPGGFSYLLAPDGVLFERTGGARTAPAMSHVHFFHEEPMCAANWYVDHLGMSLPAVRNEDDTTSPQPPHEPCTAERGPAGWPSLERAGTVRQPRAGVAHGNGSMSWYPRQCVDGRCGEDRPLVPSRGQAIDHLAFSVESIDAWHLWLSSRGVTVIEAPRSFDTGRSFMFEGPDRLAIELVEAGLAGP
jgi:catechol 2,3-dioxygenase-like lactoylglutathione lyase family enzyme